jgi:hypothetical protein
MNNHIRPDEIEIFGEMAKKIIDSDKPSYDKYILLTTMAQNVRAEIKPITLLKNLAYLDNKTFGELVCFISTKGNVKTDDANSKYLVREYSEVSRIEILGTETPRNKIYRNEISTNDTPRNKRCRDEISSHEIPRNKRSRNEINIDENDLDLNEVPRNEISRTQFNKKEQTNTNERNFISRDMRYSPLNMPASFHNGQPCLRCNNLAELFNAQKQKISMPKQHPYGKCPLYCNICLGSQCRNFTEHLKYSCRKCNSTYSNHPTERCIL